MSNPLWLEWAQRLQAIAQTAEFPLVEFRDSPAVRQAYVVGSTLAVWEALMVAEAYGMDADRAAGHLQWTTGRVREVLRYAQAFAIERAPCARIAT